MDTIRKLRSPWVIVTFLLASYVGPYFVVGSYGSVGPPGQRSYYPSGDIQPIECMRLFKHKWMYDFYRPMIYVEEKVRGRGFLAWCNDPRMLD